MSLYKRGNVWWYKFRFAGQVIRDSAKTSSKTVAVAAERSRRRDLEEGFNGIHRPARAQLFTIAAGKWQQDRAAHVAPKTAALYELALKHLSGEFGGMLLAGISPEDISRYQTRRTAAGAAGRTVNLEVGVLRAILRRNKLWGAISDNVQFLRERHDIGRALSPEEEARLLEVARERRYSDSPLYIIIVLALNTAMRSQEIRSLRWSQVDLIGRTITVGNSKTDAGSGRVIPLNQAAFAVLAHWHSCEPEAKAQQYVFPACENHKVDRLKPLKSFRTAWRNATRGAGLPGLRFHDLRHTAITKLSETLTSDQTVMAIAGHVSRRMLDHYSHIRMEAKRKALEAILQPGFQGNGAQNWAQFSKPGKTAIAN